MKLANQPFLILVALLEKPGDLVTREELRQRIWSTDTFVDFDIGLNTAIMRLRQALGDSAENPRFVETLPSRGYRFIAPVDSVGDQVVSADRNRSLKSAEDARIEIEDTRSGPAIAPAIGNTRLRWIVAAMTTVAFASIATVYLREKSVGAPPEMRLEITTPSTLAPFEFALSPGGRHIVFVASGSGSQRLWLRALDQTEAQPLAGTEGADYPFWSPDSRSIGFFAQGKLKRIDIAGGAPQVLANTSSNFGGAWNVDGTILFHASLVGPLLRIAASGGGEPVVATRLDPPRQIQHRFPQFLPDGRHFLFYAVGTPEASGIYLGSLVGEEPKRLAASDTAGAYLAPGMIVFMRQTALMAQHLDLKRGELTGDPVRLADSVGSSGVPGFGGFSVSTEGEVAYRPGGPTLRQLKWYDRTGKALGAAGEPDWANLLYPELSRDGGHVAFQRTVQGDVDVWLMDLIRPVPTRFTFDPAADSHPVWSPDGMRIAFLSSRKGRFNLYVKPLSGPATEELLLETPNDKFPHDWSKDGRFLLYSELHPKTGRDLWALPMSGANASPTGRSHQEMTGNDRKPIVIVKTPFEELNGQFSPDGHWIAYETNESGRFEIVVQSFPEPTGRWQISTGGGTQPRWRADGKELYFMAPDGKLMAASIAATDTTFAAKPPVPLFPAVLATESTHLGQQYTVSRDGRFLIDQPVEASTTPPITLILNWKPRP